MAYRGNPNYMVTIMQTHDAPSSGNTGNVTVVQAPIPDTFMFDTAVQYEAPFTQSLSGIPLVDSALRAAGMQLITQTLTAQIWQGSVETELGLDLEFQAETDAYQEVHQPILRLLKLSTPSLNQGDILNTPGPQLDFKEIIGSISSSSVEDVKNSAAEWAANSDIIGPGVKFVGNMIDSNTTTTDGSSRSSTNEEDSSSRIGFNVDTVKRNIRNQISIKIGNFCYFDSVVVTNVQKTYTSLFDESGLPHHARVNVRFKPLFMIVQQDLDKIFAPPGSRSAQTSSNNTVVTNPIPPVDPDLAQGVENVATAIPVNMSSGVTRSNIG